MMMCQICKTNPASIHIQEIVNGKKQTLHLCLSCAGKKTLAHAMFDGMDLSDVLQSLEKNLADMGLPFPGSEPEENTEKKETPKEDIVCPVCSWSETLFKKTGQMGCPACYEAFAPLLRERLPVLHRSCQHEGKLPQPPAGGSGFFYHRDLLDADDETPAARERMREEREKEVAELEKDLKESVRREEFELAADLRDRIRTLRAA